MAKRLTQEHADAIIDAMERGQFFTAACFAIGITRRQGETWRGQGERDLYDGKDTLEARFLRRYNEVMAEQAQQSMDIVRNAHIPVGEDQRGRPVYLPDSAIRAHKWLLSKRFPYEFSDQAKLELTGPGGGPLETVRVQVAERNEGRALYGMPPLEVVVEGEPGGGPRAALPEHSDQGPEPEAIDVGVEMVGTEAGEGVEAESEAGSPLGSEAAG
jgi:hypothetical protein